MSGIIGYVGLRGAIAIVLEGLKRLQYRRNDSAGIATTQNGRISIRRAESELRTLVHLVKAYLSMLSICNIFSFIYR